MGDSDLAGTPGWRERLAAIVSGLLACAPNETTALLRIGDYSRTVRTDGLAALAAAAPSPQEGGGGAGGMDLIRAERRRQVEVEGWTTEHDREHGALRLYRAGWCYETWDPSQANARDWRDAIRQRGWPWDVEWWKPKERLRNLVRAGALYMAALDLDECHAASVVSQDSLRGHIDRVAAAIDRLLAEVRAAAPPPAGVQVDRSDFTVADLVTETRALLDAITTFAAHNVGTEDHPIIDAANRVRCRLDFGKFLPPAAGVQVDREALRAKIASVTAGYPLSGYTNMPDLLADRLAPLLGSPGETPPEPWELR